MANGNKNYEGLLSDTPPYLFFTGKGGVGKTSTAAASAIALADSGLRVLLVSTDPASNLDEVLGTALGSLPAAVIGVDRLDAMNIDPMEAAAAYRERVVGPYRGLLSASAIVNIEEQLSGACTVEIAAFDKFTAILTDPEIATNYDRVIFDTAPTGHTLKLPNLPSAWNEFMETSNLGISCIGPLSAMTAQQESYRVAITRLTDPLVTEVVLVSRPDPISLDEAARAAVELNAIGISRQRLVINGLFTASDLYDPLANALGERAAQSIANMPVVLANLPRDTVPLRSLSPVGVDGLRALARNEDDHLAVDEVSLANIEDLATWVDELAVHGSGLVMTMGKGGVGKTTIASAIALELARRGHDVELSTTDPAAHISDVLGEIESTTTNLKISRLDPAEETLRYTNEVLGESGSGLDENAYALLEEDLKSPCTAEIAVFRAFAKTVDSARNKFVVLDTAPTGHTVLLLDAARQYHKEAGRQANAVPPEVENLLNRLNDPMFTHVVVVTLPEATPVHEAAFLQGDLQRAGIEPSIWVINQSLWATSSTDKVLRSRAVAETRLIEEIQQVHARRSAIVPMMTQPPIGNEGLAKVLTACTSVS